jgi:DNA-binding CsgD family transcriptional regulator
MAATTGTDNGLGIACHDPTGLSQELETLILPLLEKLKGAKSNPLQAARLIGLLESNLRHLVKAYGNVGSLAAVYQRLTPVERLVASMVRQGLPTKDIATALAVSPGTVSIHRKHVRKKLGLGGTITNLHSYLLSLS